MSGCRTERIILHRCLKGCLIALDIQHGSRSVMNRVFLKSISALVRGPSGSLEGTILDGTIGVDRDRARAEHGDSE